MMRIGLDVGSTTLKCVVLNEQNEVLFKKYERHLSRIVEKSVEMLCEVAEQFPKEKVLLSISGSAGMGLAERSDIQFVQEVYATRIAVNRLVPGTDAVIELGGEDAKILFLTDGNNASGLEVRMNGSCAGGTGAFIDQMATLLNITPDALNTLSKEHEKIYTIASRCGVFAKSDIQPLLNQVAQKKDVAASILYAVVNQTVAGLAQGKRELNNSPHAGNGKHQQGDLNGTHTSLPKESKYRRLSWYPKEGGRYPKGMCEVPRTYLGALPLRSRSLCSTRHSSQPRPAGCQNAPRSSPSGK